MLSCDVLRYRFVILRGPASEDGRASVREEDAQHLLWMPGKLGV